MKLSARSAAFYSATVAGLLMLSACGKNDQQAANAPAASSTAAAPAAAATSVKPAAASTATAPAKSATAPAPASTAPAAAAPAPAPTDVAATNDGFHVSTVTLGDAVTPDHKVRKDTTSFAPTAKTIYASVDTEGSTAGSTLSAKWSYLEGKGQLVNSISQSITADGPSTTTFKVQNPNLWPEGKYKVEISVDGKQVASKTFDVITKR